MISLPKSWINNNNIKKGDVIGLQQEKNNIILSANPNKEEPLKEITINIDNLDRISILYYIRSLYRKGYEIIRINFNNQTCIHHKTNEVRNVISVIHEEVNRLVGVEIIQQKQNKCVIKSISETSLKDFEIILRRIFLLLKDAMNDFIHGVETNNIFLVDTIEEKHNTISKFISYCLRILNQRGYKNPENAYQLYHIVASLDKVTDFIKYSAKYFLKNKTKFSKENKKILKTMSETLELYSELFYKFDINKVTEISKLRYKIKNAMDIENRKMSKGESVILNDMKNIQELILDLTEARMSIEH